MRTVIKTSVILASLLSASLGLSDDSQRSPFDGRSCNSAVMSAGRALELLGPNATVNLAQFDDEPETYTRVYYRFRNKIGGKTGPWFESRPMLHALSPYLSNRGGELTFSLVINADTPRDAKRVACVKKNAFEVNCEDKQGQLREWGSGLFFGTIANDCLRLKSKASSNERDEEWVYYMPIL